MRAAVGLLCTLGLLLGLAAMVDAGLTRSAEREAAERVRAETGAVAAEVDLRGWPVSLRLATGSVPEAFVTATDVPIPDRAALISLLEVTLTDLALRLDDLQTPGAVPVRAATGRFEARLDADALTALTVESSGTEGFVDRVEPVVTPDGTGVVRVTLASGLGTVDAVPEAREGSLVLRPVQALPIGPAELVVPLRDLPAGATVDGIHVEPGALVLAGDVEDLLLQPEPAAG